MRDINAEPPLSLIIFKGLGKQTADPKWVTNTNGLKRIKEVSSKGG